MDDAESKGQFVADLKRALRQYGRVGLGESTLARTLRLVDARLGQQKLPDTAFNRATVLRQILLECMEALKASGQTEASTILRERFVEEKPVLEVARGLSVAEATLYSKQSKAQSALAAILWQRERVEAERAHAQAQRALRKLPPPTYTRLFGVAERLDRLTSALDDVDGRWLITLDGLGGVGKTALAREAAERAITRGRFADLVWETARQERFIWGKRQEIAGPTLTFEMLLDAIARQLGHLEICRQTLEQKTTDIRFLLDEAPYLIVVDNLETAIELETIVDELWALTNPSKILVTSRRRLVRYEQAHALRVGPLDDAAAVAFMRYHGAERGIAEVAEAPEETLLSIQRVVQGNPLAIKLVIGQVDRRPLAKVLADLQAVRGDTADLYAFIYNRSWDMLTDAAQVLLLNMPHLPPTGGEWDDLLAVSGLAESVLASAVDELIDLSLLNVGDREELRYSIHQLTRHFVLSELVQA